MLFALLLGSARSAPLDAAFDAAGERWAVPAPLLQALAFEATRVDPEAASTWGGYGLFDFGEGEVGGPDIELVARISGHAPDALLLDPELQIDGAAALLAHYAEGLPGGAPPVDALELWAEPAGSFASVEIPRQRDAYVAYVYGVLFEGFSVELTQLEPQDVELTELQARAAPPPSTSDYYGAAAFEQAHSDNYSNYSRPSDYDVLQVVIHTVQGSYSGCISWFQNASASASAHYVVRSSDGEVTQMVWEEDVAWHAGHWDTNATSVGIEHEGYVEQPSVYYTDAMYAGSAELTADIVDRYGLTIDRSVIIGHHEVPGCSSGSGGGASCHTDPGDGWDWDYYLSEIERIAGGGASASARMLGYVADGDIYDASARLSDVTVELVGAGETTVTDSSGLWSFDGLTAGTWTAEASASGYQTGSCTATVSTGSGDWWCSIALEPDDGGGDGDGGDGSDGGDSDDSVDTGLDGGDDPSVDGPEVGSGRLIDPDARLLVAGTGCGCAAAGTAGSVWLVGLLGLYGRRRR